MSAFPKVAVVYLSYHAEQYLPEAAEGWGKLTYPRDSLVIVIVDNPHPEFGLSENFIREKILPRSGHDLPEIVYLSQEKNFGFAGGNNAGIRWALERGFDYVFLHNQDGYLAPEALEKMTAVMEKDQSVGAAQALILLAGEKDLVNTSGSRYHYLGFGYSGDFKKNINDLKLTDSAETGYASGAAIMLRADLLKQNGLLDEDFFLYHEDLEYGLRLRSLGYQSVAVFGVVFYHHYAFSRNAEKFYLMERNRWAVLMMYYKWPTLILLLPMLILVEVGVVLMAWRNGWLKEKIAAYKYWFGSKHAQAWLEKRKNIQKSRKAGDRQLLGQAVGRIVFEDKTISSPLLTYFGNPFMAIYWWVAKKLIWW